MKCVHWWPILFVFVAREPARSEVGGVEFLIASRLLFVGVAVRPEKMQRDIWFIAQHPTVVTGRSGWNVEEHAGAEYVNSAVLHRGRGRAGEHQPNMLDI